MAKSLESSINFTPVDIACAVFGSFYLILILISGTILNTLVVYLVSRSKKLRTQAFAVAVQIALANLGTIIFLGMSQLIFLCKGCFSVEVCIIQGYVIHILVDVRVLLVFLYSLDRFASVFAPFMYPRHNLKLTVINSVSAWFVVTVSNVLGIPQIWTSTNFQLQF